MPGTDPLDPDHVPTSGAARRTVIRTGAWLAPTFAVAMAAPSATASGGLVIQSTPTGFDGRIDTITLTDSAAIGTTGTIITVTATGGASWVSGSGTTRPFTPDANGVVVLPAGSLALRPGEFSGGISVASTTGSTGSAAFSTMYTTPGPATEAPEE